MKLDFKSNSRLWIMEASRLMGVAPVITMMSALFMLILAVFSVKDLMSASDAERKSQDLPEFTLKRLPVGKAVYDEYASVLSRLSPDVQVNASRDGIRIEIADASKYAEFMYVLNSIQGISKDVIWRADEICLAGCSGLASQAVVKGLTEKVEVKLRGNHDE